MQLPGTPDRNRRGVLKGLAALPSVLTLHSGAALAAASATCVTKSSPTGQLLAPSGTDTLERRRAVLGKIGGDDYYCVSGNYTDLTSGACVNGGAAQGSWYKDGPINGPYVTAPAGSINLVSDSSVPQQRYAVVFIRDDGGAAQLKPGDVGYHAAFQSCAGSFGF